MPLNLTSDADLERIDLPAQGEWVSVKRKLGKDDEREITRRTLAGQMVSRAELTHIADFEFDLGVAVDSATFATLEVAIKEWSFPEEITARNIRALDDASLSAIKTKLEELYPGPRSDDDRKNSSGNGAPPSSAEAPFPANSVGSP